jgi:hypothetical protein
MRMEGRTWHGWGRACHHLDSIGVLFLITCDASVVGDAWGRMERKPRSSHELCVKASEYGRSGREGALTHGRLRSHLSLFIRHGSQFTALRTRFAEDLFSWPATDLSLLLLVVLIS